MKIRAFITHKLAEQFKDCQDRFSINQDTKSVALADGMSQSYQQKIWAALLTDSYTSNTDFVPNKASIEELSVQWHEQVKKYIEDLNANQAPQYLIIMNTNALAMRKSAGATFLGIRFEENRWNGDVLGDSCLIVLQDNRIKDILTSQDGDEFDNHPDYFDSDASRTGKGTPKQINGIVNANTSIMLVSDPFSDFLNEKRKEGKDEEYVKELLQVTNHDEFEALVDKWRKEYGMHNDDSTLIIIEDDSTDKFNCTHVDEIQSLIDDERQKQEEKAAQTEENPQKSECSKIPSNEGITGQTDEVKNVHTQLSEKEFIEFFYNKYQEYIKNKNPLQKFIQKFCNAKQNPAIKYALSKMYEIIYKK